ncbi:uncharacterized protein LOC111811121 [Cucurbita pepo subsp. pepo]|uniref:uncharacterized protein LOC111811121 n=1 Tax=Cucurbita pepo subsp. pepo TaxID=3664 RepID=UPI000C9D9875|nr:uncharacterized protein LOC111811121 [Cucurbita pepo subsp. pepo]
MRSATFLRCPYFLLPVHGFSSSTSKNSIKFKPTFFNSRAKPARLVVFCCRDSEKSVRNEQSVGIDDSNRALMEKNIERMQWNVEVGSPSVRFQPLAKLSLNDKASLLLTFIALTASVAFTSLVIAAVPTLNAMRRAAISLSKLADTAREELPGTMAAIRLSGMEISDLTLELSDLSQEIADGVNKSAQAVQAAEAGIRQISAVAHQKTMSMIQERADLPVISLQPVVAGAAKKTSRAVGKATRTIMKMISGGESMENDDDNSLDRLEV